MKPPTTNGPIRLITNHTLISNQTLIASDNKETTAKRTKTTAIKKMFIHQKVSKPDVIKIDSGAGDLI